MPKLLQVNVTANWGSTGKIAEEIGMAAMSRGWESTIAYGRYTNPSCSQLIKVGNRLDVYMHYAKNILFDKEGLGSKSATLNFIDQVKEYSPDIIQLHNLHDHWINYPLLFNYLSTIDVPVVWTLHDCWPFTGGCPHFENYECYKWRNDHCLHCTFNHKESNNNFKKKIDSYSSLKERLHLVAVSKWLADYTQQSFFKDITPNIQVIHNGIDITKFDIGNQQKESLIVGVSNIWNDAKGLQDFIKLRELLPHSINIVLIGVTEQQKRNLPFGIEGKTRTNSIEELVYYYQSAKAFINPTYNDTFPTVNIEALACGTPVITYKTGGSPEAIDKETGIIIEKGNIPAMADAILRIFNKQANFNPEICRQRAVSSFNKNHQFNKYIDLYDSLIKQHVDLQR